MAEVLSFAFGGDTGYQEGSRNLSCKRGDWVTIVIACHFLNHIAVFADCRVSYGRSVGAVDDNLQKLYQFDKVILGFSGPVQGANQVIQTIKRNVEALPRRKRSVAADLQRDIERWIRYEYQRIEPTHRKDLTFLLASVEPRREVRAKCKKRMSDGTEVEIPKPQWLPSIHEMSTLVLKPSRSDRLVKEKRRMFEVIGPSNSDCEAIRDVLQKSYGDSFKQPALQARIVADWLMVTLMERNVIEVGGLFQYALLGAWGICWLPYSSSSSHGNVAMVLENGHFVQRDNIKGETFPLLTTWEWCEWQRTHPPGSSGAFEDPALRTAVDAYRQQTSRK